MMRLAVTGADGFVGRHVCRTALARGIAVRPIVRDETCAERFGGLCTCASSPVVVGDIGPSTDWTAALDGVDAVVHLAARVHVMDEAAEDPLEAYREINVHGTEHLARSASAAGVSRFVFVSSVKVNGESTTGRAPFSERDVPAPEDPYGVSKHEAEQALARVGAETTLETVVVRPPLVYGPGVGGNLSRLLGMIAGGRPIPLGSVRNRRSLIGVENLADVLVLCSMHPAAAGRTFMVSDGDDVSTADLVRRLAEGMGRPSRLVPVPLFLLKSGLGMIGKSEVYDRLAGSLEVDASVVRTVLDWTPPVPVRQGLLDTAAWFRDERFSRTADRS